MVENDGLSNADRAQAETIAERLRDIGEQLDDLALSVLREAAESGSERPVADKRLTSSTAISGESRIRIGISVRRLNSARSGVGPNWLSQQALQ